MKKQNFELRRKIFHVFLGIFILASALLIPQIKWMLFYTLVLGMLVSIASVFFRIPFISFMLDNFERPVYRKTFPGKGLLFFLAGSLLVLKLFPSDIALASIAILTFSDPFFSFDKRVFKGIFKFKKLRSFLLGLIAGVLAASFFISPISAFLATLIAAVIESIAIFLGSDQVDDNIIIPITAGTALYVLPRII
jgi:dolichol kinase